MFDSEHFVADCNVAGASGGQSGVLEVVSRAVSAPREILDVWESRGAQGFKCSTDCRAYRFESHLGTADVPTTP